MTLIGAIVLAIIILILVVVAVFVIDKTFTGPAAEFAWLAKIVVGLIALVGVIYLVAGVAGVHLDVLHT